MTINELADKFYEDFKDEKLKGPLEEFVKLAFRTGYMTGHMTGYNKGQLKNPYPEDMGH